MNTIVILMKMQLFCLLFGIFSIAFGQSNNPNSNTGAPTSLAIAYVNKSDGLTWFKALPDKYSSGCLDDNFQTDLTKCTAIQSPDGKLHILPDSPTEKACSDFGQNVRLPTMADYNNLISQFDHETDMFGNGMLTSNGVIQMNSIFGDLDENVFWTSDLIPGATFPETAIVFFYNNDDGGITQRVREATASIRCVSKNN
jgi:hypothetical protein